MVLVGIFDDERTLEKAIERLDEAGLGDEVQRLEGQVGAGAAGSAGAAEGGAEPADLARSEAVNAPWAGHLRAAEPASFGGGVLEDEEREYYRRLLAEGGKLLVLDLEEGRANEAQRALEQAGASRVTRHGR